MITISNHFYYRPASSTNSPQRLLLSSLHHPYHYLQYTTSTTHLPCSSSTTSFTPLSTRWYNTDVPTTPPPHTTTSAPLGTPLLPLLPSPTLVDEYLRCVCVWNGLHCLRPQVAILPDVTILLTHGRPNIRTTDIVVFNFLQKICNFWDVDLIKKYPLLFF